MTGSWPLLGHTIGDDSPLWVIAGPCVIESETLALDVAWALRDMAQRLGLPLIYKSSFDKANRSSHHSFRGPGLDEGLRILSQVRAQTQLPVITDVHEDTPLQDVAAVVDVLQTPAFLCRQTNFLQRVMQCGLPVNIKKGQFLAPWDMEHVLAKARAAGQQLVLACERGVSFGYNQLVSDMRSIPIMRRMGCPVVFDATHSVQCPGGGGSVSSGRREFVPCLAQAAVAAGADAVFLETHPDPDRALSDGPNMWPLDQMEVLLKQLSRLRSVILNP